MDRRKLIKFGSSSHVLSIPNYWLKKNKLKKGDLLYFDENKDGELILFHELRREESLKKITIKAENKSLDRLGREILSAYINNFNVIVITGDNLNILMKEIRKILHSFVALEIVEEDNKKIIAKDFLNLKDISIYENIRRMDIIIRGMFEDMVKSAHEDLSSSIYQRDYDVNRFCFLILRAINGAMDNPAIARTLTVQHKDLLPIWTLSSSMEDIGDEIKRVSRFLSGQKLDDEMKKSFKNIFLKVEKAYLDVMKAYYTNNIELAFQIDSLKDVLIDDCNKLFEKYPSSGTGRILERLKKLIYGIGSIGWVVFGSGFSEKEKTSI